MQFKPTFTTARNFHEEQQRLYPKHGPQENAKPVNANKNPTKALAKQIRQDVKKCLKLKDSSYEGVSRWHVRGYAPDRNILLSMFGINLGANLQSQNTFLAKVALIDFERAVGHIESRIPHGGTLLITSSKIELTWEKEVGRYTLCGSYGLKVSK